MNAPRLQSDIPRPEVRSTGTTCLTLYLTPATFGNAVGSFLSSSVTKNLLFLLVNLQGLLFRWMMDGCLTLQKRRSHQRKACCGRKLMSLEGSCIHWLRGVKWRLRGRKCSLVRVTGAYSELRTPNTPVLSLSLSLYSELRSFYRNVR